MYTFHPTKNINTYNYNLFVLIFALTNFRAPRTKLFETPLNRLLKTKLLKQQKNGNRKFEKFCAPTTKLQNFGTNFRTIFKNFSARKLVLIRQKKIGFIVKKVTNSRFLF